MTPYDIVSYAFAFFIGAAGVFLLALALKIFVKDL